MILQACHKLATTIQGCKSCNNHFARLLQPRNFHMDPHTCSISVYKVNMYIAYIRTLLYTYIYKCMQQCIMNGSSS